MAVERLGSILKHLSPGSALNQMYAYARPCAPGTAECVAVV
jgi:hypothetical protein